MSDQTTIRASYRYVHGAHFFTSPEVPGLCAADRDISTAYGAVGAQLATLMGGEWMPREQFPHNQAWPIGDQLVWVKSVTRDVQEHQNPPPPEVATPQPGQGGCAPPTSGGPHRFASPQEGEIEIVTDDQTTISDAEIMRLQRARAVARRSALREAAELLDAYRKEIEAGNPGRRRGTLSKAGAIAAGAVLVCADRIWAMREQIEVPST